MQLAEPVRRTLEIEEFTNRICIHPLAGWLARRFASIGITPNAVSLFGMACGIAASFAYFRYDRTGFVIAGFGLMILWHVMDGADGQLARLTNAQSEIGRVLDGICDYVTFIGVYAALALRLGARDGGWVWVVIVLAGACHAVQSAVYERQREEYERWGLGRNKGGPAGPGAAAVPASPVAALFRTAWSLYAGVQSFASVPDANVRRELAAGEARLPVEQFRQRYRETFAPSVRRWSVLSANTRTMGIFAFALCGVPLFYFYAEIAGLSATLVLLLVGQQRRYRRFAASLAVAGQRLAVRNR